MPVVAVLGPRQCGKSTLARMFLADREDSVILDLERPADLRALSDPEAFFDVNRNRLVCIDEIQRRPELFPVLRYVVDDRSREGQFLILGSASPELIRQGSETLAGRVAFIELTPLLHGELRPLKDPVDMREMWLRGGYPRSLLASRPQASFDWRLDFIRTFLERDIPALGLRLPGELLRRFWTMCAHVNGQTVNYSKIGESLGVSHNTIRSYLDVLCQTYMIRMLPPWTTNLKTRLVRAPKLYFRDTGLLHALLEIETQNQLLSHPGYGSSWEAFAMENTLSWIDRRWRASHYRTPKGAEVDLVLERGKRRVAVEFKASSAPMVGRGFWSALESIDPTEAWVVAPVERRYPLKKGTSAEVAPLHSVMEALA